MRPETLPLVSDFKKEYKFLWLVTANQGESVSRTAVMYNGSSMQEITKNISIRQFMKSKNIDGMELFEAVVMNPLFSGYISQLAQTVNVPDDEFELETIPQGPVEYKMPTKVKMEDINVTYLEDSFETVYNFHKAWFQAIRCGKGVGINSPLLFSATARYIPFEDTMLATEYVLFKNQIAQYVNSAISSNYAMPSLPTGAKATSIITYPRIYPTKIHRTPANHSGTDIATVEVTYARIPDFVKKHSALQMWNGASWTNTNNDLSYFTD